MKLEPLKSKVQNYPKPSTTPSKKWPTTLKSINNETNVIAFICNPNPGDAETGEFPTLWKKN